MSFHFISRLENVAESRNKCSRAYNLALCFIKCYKEVICGFKKKKHMAPEISSVHNF